MSSTQNTLIAGVVVALIIGVAIGYFVYPSMNPQTPGDEWVSKSSYDQLQSQYQAAQADLSDAQAEIAKLTAPKKVGLILATGGLGDKSFNDISYAGCMRAKEDLGVDFDYVESSAIAEYEGYQRDFASSGEYMLIICIGFDQADALAIVAAEYPEQNFALVDMVVDNPNVASLTFRANEGSFLVGVVAGMVTESDKVGFVGGMDIPLIRDFFEGYEAGAQWANPAITVSDPVFVGDWADPTKGKELSLALIEQGSDCIYSAAGKSGLGALEGAHEEGVYTFGVDACQCYLYDEIIASMTKRVDVAVYEMILDALIGKFQGGFYSGGVAEGWVGLCRLPEEEPLWEETFEFEHLELPDEVINKVIEAKNAILAGDIVVPTGYD
jgi:basic membrane protein A